MSSPPPQWLGEAMTTKRTEATPALSSVEPATTVAGWAHADKANKGQISAITSRHSQHSGWLIPSKPIERRPEQRSHLSCQPPKWLSETTPTERTEAGTAPFPVVHTTTEAG